jgi:hypothetical protein
MHRPAANRTAHFATRISLGIGRQMLFQQSTRQAIAQIARPLFPLLKGNQPVLPVAPEHPIKRLTGLFLELLPPFPQFIAGKSRHDRSSMIGDEPMHQSIRATELSLGTPRAATVLHPPWLTV